MFRLIIAATAIGLSAAAAASTSNVYVERGTAHVRYGDLNLQSHGDRQRLVGRIHRGAQMLCDAPDADPMQLSPAGACYRVAIADGVAQMNGLAHR
jgi:UrcA family protein